jgi:protein TonB
LGGVVGGVLGGVVGEIEAPVRAIGEIKPPRLIRKVEPTYPEIARQARVEGIVIVEATTDIYGRVQKVKVLRSIPLLDQAAIDAVRQWQYEPMIINGRPRGVIFTVTVRFQLK